MLNQTIVLPRRSVPADLRRSCGAGARLCIRRDVPVGSSPAENNFGRIDAIRPNRRPSTTIPN